MKQTRKLIFGAGCLLLLAGTLSAQTQREIQQARRLRADASFHEVKGERQEALEKFQESLRLVDDPAIREKVAGLLATLAAGGGEATAAGGREQPVDRLMAVLQLEEAVTEAVALTLVQLMTLFPELRDYEDILIDYADERLDWETVKPVIAAWYAESFSDLEMLELVRFHDTPLGRKWVQNTPLFAARMEAFVRDRFSADLDVLELRMKNRELDLALDRSVFFDAAEPGEVRGD